MKFMNIEILNRYRCMLSDKEVPFNSDITTREHLLWMIEEIEKNKEQSITKKHRWLGYIQGIMIAEKIATVDKERDFTRPLLNGD